MPGSVSPLLHQGLVELAAGTGVDGGPAVLTVVLQAGDVGAEERSKLAPTARALALVTQLVVQDVWLHFHLGMGCTHKARNTQTHTETHTRRHTQKRNVSGHSASPVQH